MISNPVSFFTDGYTERKFTHEGGDTLYHFCPHDNGLSNVFDTNIVFFANSEQHAMKVLQDMFEFVISCFKEHLNNKPSNSHITQKRMTRYATYLTALRKGKIRLEKAPTNQFYKVGWAENDTI